MYQHQATWATARQSATGIVGGTSTPYGSPRLLPSPYPLHAFPDSIRQAIEELQRTYQAPLPLIGSTVLAALSVAAQSSVKVRLPISDHAKPATLYFLTIAESGERKSAVERAIFSPLYDIDAERETAYADAMENFQYDLRDWQHQNDHIEKQLANPLATRPTVLALSEQLDAHRRCKPHKPRLRRLIRMDTSERALLNALEGTGESVALVGDEAEILLRSPLFEKTGLMNKAWDGGTITLDRANDVSFTARDMRMTISLMAQSSVIGDYVRKRGSQPRGSGFFARFLLSWPISTQGHRFLSPTLPSQGYLDQFHDRLRQMLAAGHQDGAPSSLHSGNYTYELNPSAKEFFVEMFNLTEHALGQGGFLADIQDFGSKCCEMVVRLAALFEHYSGQRTSISRDSLERASEIILFHVHEFKRIFGEQPTVDPVEQDAPQVLAYLHHLYRSTGQTVFLQKDVQHDGPIQHRTRFKRVLDRLCQQRAIWMVKDKARRIYIQVTSPVPVYLPR